MLRFIRRLFVLLILFIIVFLVYRYINPIWASMFVEKMKSIPDQISDFIDWNSDVSIVWTTVTITWDVDVLKDEIDVWNNTWDKYIDDSDLTWLEELNEEINSILNKEDWTWEYIIQIEDDILTGSVISWNNEDTTAVITWDDVWGSWYDVIYTGNVVNPDNVELTDTDYKQMEDVFGNLVE